MKLFLGFCLYLQLLQTDRLWFIIDHRSLANILIDSISVRRSWKWIIDEYLSNLIYLVNHICLEMIIFYKKKFFKYSWKLSKNILRSQARRPRMGRWLTGFRFLLAKILKFDVNFDWKIYKKWIFQWIHSIQFPLLPLPPPPFWYCVEPILYKFSTIYKRTKVIRTR